MTLGSPIPFSDAVVDATGGNTKIQRKDYLRAGLLPVIDQGQEDIAGYTDYVESAYQGQLPVVLFGDHTRTFKYVDAPFALGADGVKVLEPKPGFNAKFLYYYFQSCDIPSHGYSRHFKYLRGISVPYFAPKEQSRIVELLDQADALRRLHRQADAKAARILPALFLKMFGDPAINPMGWSVKEFAETFRDTTAGNEKLQSKQFQLSGKLAVIDQGQEQIAGYTDDESLAYVGSLPVIVFGDHTRIFKFVDQPFVLGADGVRVLSAKDSFNPLFAYWHCQLLNIPSAGYSRHFKYLKEKSFMCPSKSLQDRFGKLARSVTAQLVSAEAAAGKIETLHSALLERAFSGQLTAKWRQAHIQELLAEMQQQAQALNLPMPTQVNP